MPHGSGHLLSDDIVAAAHADCHPARLCLWLLPAIVEVNGSGLLTASGSMAAMSKQCAASMWLDELERSAAGAAASTALADSSEYAAELARSVSADMAMNITDAIIFNGLLLDIKNCGVVTLKTIVAFKKFLNIIFLVEFCYVTSGKKEKSTNKMNSKNNKMWCHASRWPDLPPIAGDGNRIKKRLCQIIADLRHSPQ